MFPSSLDLALYQSVFVAAIRSLLHKLNAAVCPEQVPGFKLPARAATLPRKTVISLLMMMTRTSMENLSILGWYHLLNFQPLRLTESSNFKKDTFLCKNSIHSPQLSNLATRDDLKFETSWKNLLGSSSNNSILKFLAIIYLNFKLWKTPRTWIGHTPKSKGTYISKYWGWPLKCCQKCRQRVTVLKTLPIALTLHKIQQTILTTNETFAPSNLTKGKLGFVYEGLQNTLKI